jgi:hypothetical protein
VSTVNSQQKYRLPPKGSRLIPKLGHLEPKTSLCSCQLEIGWESANLDRACPREAPRLQQLPSAGVGIAAGVVGAAALTRVMTSLLFGVSTTDAFTFETVPALLAAVAFAATVIPAWRATRVDPMVALREE